MVAHLHLSSNQFVVLSKSSRNGSRCALVDFHKIPLLRGSSSFATDLNHQNYSFAFFLYLLRGFRVLISFFWDNFEAFDINLGS